MTKRQAMQKVRELAQTARKTLIEDAEHLLASGAIDLSKYEDNYCLPKILISASLKRKGDMYSPLYDSHKEEVDNLLRF